MRGSALSKEAAFGIISITNTIHKSIVDYCTKSSTNAFDVVFDLQIFWLVLKVLQEPYLELRFCLVEVLVCFRAFLSMKHNTNRKACVV